MRPIALKIVISIYVISFSFYATEIWILEPLGIEPRNIQGKPVNYPTTEIDTASIWDVIQLASGSYHWQFLELVGVHEGVIYMLSAVMPVFIAYDVARYALGRM